MTTDDEIKEIKVEKEPRLRFNQRLEWRGEASQGVARRKYPSSNCLTKDKEGNGGLDGVENAAKHSSSSSSSSIITARNRQQNSPRSPFFALLCFAFFWVGGWIDDWANQSGINKQKKKRTNERTREGGRDEEEEE